MVIKTVIQSFTKTVSGGTIEITEEDGLSAFSIKVLSGSVTVLGAGTFQGQNSEPLQFPAGESYTMVAPQYAVLGNYTIDGSGGSFLIDIQK